MSKLFKNRINQIVLGIVLIGTITLILNGKIDLKNVMANATQKEFVCLEGQILKDGLNNR